MKSCKTFFVFIAGFLSCLVILITGIAGTAYYFAAYPGGMGKLDEKITIDWLKFSEEVKEMSALEYGKRITLVFEKINELTVEEIEVNLGLNITQKLNEFTGIDVKVFKSSKLADLIDNTMNNFTLDVVKNKFNVVLPDIPLFNDPEFLSSPLLSAFNEMDKISMDKFIKIVYSGEEQNGEVASSILLQKLGKKSLTDISSGMDTIINEMKLSEVIIIGDDANPVLKKMKDLTISQLGGNEVNNIINSMKLSEVITLTEGETNGVLWQLKDLPIGELGSAQGAEAINNLKMKDVITINENSSSVLKMLADVTVGNLGTEETDRLIKSMPIVDLIGIENPTNKILQFFKDNAVTADSLDASLNDMTLGDIIDTATGAHIWGYLGSVKVNDLGFAIENMTMGNVIEIDESSAPILKALKNCAIDDIGSAVNTLKLSDVITINDDAHPLLKAMRDDGVTIENLASSLSGIINNCTLGELIEIPEGASGILAALKNVKVSQLSDAVDKLTVADVFGADRVGLLSLLSDTVKLKDISTEIGSITFNTTIRTLINHGILSDPIIHQHVPNPENCIICAKLETEFYSKTLVEILVAYSEKIIKELTPPFPTP